MSGSWTVFRREVDGYLGGPAFWISALLFVVTMHALFFFLGHPVGDLRLPSFWEGREASLRPLFAWLPLFFVGLAPALTMGAWAEEGRSGTEELLLTGSLRARHAVLGKFLASWMMLSLLVVCSVLPLAVVVSLLGPLDWGAVLGGMLGGCLLAASCCAIGVACSALTNEQLLAFAISAAILGALWSTQMFLRVLPSELATAVASLSPYTHYLETAAAGVFDARDVLYHVLLCWIALTLNTLWVEGRRWR